MRVRTKLLLSMVILIAFMGSVYFALSYGYTGNLFRRYAASAKQGTAEQWAQVLAYYYENDGNTWFHVSEYISAILAENQGSRATFQSLALYDTEHHLITAFGMSETNTEPANPVQVPVVVGGRTVGELVLQSTPMHGMDQVERTALNSMTFATIAGIVITSLVALILGVWLARILTKPLQSMMRAMRQIQAGDLSVRLDIGSQDELGQVGQTFNDMTQRLSRTEEARRHLVADVAHELRTPLTIIQGQLELIQQGVKTAGPETLLPIQDEVFRLTLLVQDLHQLSLAEVGKLHLERKETDLHALLERMVDNFQFEAEEREIQLHFESSASSPLMLFLDPNRIMQVFVNLLGNALRYTEAKGTVRVGLHVNGDFAIVEVVDTGKGISPEHLTHIFNRFYRADEDRSREKGGTGLGLAIAKEFVEAHHGEIEVSSVKGQGTTFRVHLPIHDTGGADSQVTHV